MWSSRRERRRRENGQQPGRTLERCRCCPDLLPLLCAWYVTTIKVVLACLRLLETVVPAHEKVSALSLSSILFRVVGCDFVAGVARRFGRSGCGGVADAIRRLLFPARRPDEGYRARLQAFPDRRALASFRLVLLVLRFMGQPLFVL